MGLFKAKEKNESERSKDVSKKERVEQPVETQDDNKSNEKGEVLAEEVAGGLSENDRNALVKFRETLSLEVYQNVEHLLTTMNPDKKGFEEMGGARWSPPIVKIHQAMTNEAPESSKQGDLYTGTGDVFERLEFTPLYMYKTRVKFEEDNSQPVCQSDNGEVSIYGNVCKDCPDFGFKKGQRSECAESINVLAFGKDMSQIYHLQFSRTSYRAGFKLFRQASATARMWDRWYALKTEERTRQGSKSKYHVFAVTPTGEKLEPALVDVASAFNEKITESRKKSRERAAQNEEAGKKAVEKLDESAFSGGSTDNGEKAPEPDFSM